MFHLIKRLCSTSDAFSLKVLQMHVHRLEVYCQFCNELFSTDLYDKLFVSNLNNSNS